MLISLIIALMLIALEQKKMQIQKMGNHLVISTC